MNIMIVEDDEGLSRGIPLALSGEGDSFFCCGKIKEARKLLKEKQIDLILLDIGLPDGDGLSFCREIRKEHSMPVLFLTANDMEYDEVAGLDAGADDYITKPFSLAVLRSRIQAAKRRWLLIKQADIIAIEEERGAERKTENREKRQSRVFLSGPYFFYFEEQRYYKDKTEIFLSRTEQRLLYVLAMNPGQVVTREILFEKIWGKDSDFVDENALSVTVGRLRRKLSYKNEKITPIQTVYGVGYKWNETDNEADYEMKQI